MGRVLRRQGGSGKLRLELDLPEGAQDFSFSPGKLCRVEGSSGETCLPAIAKALEAKKVEAPSASVDCLEFNLALLGRNLARGTGEKVTAGQLTSDKSGTWTSLKVFVAEGEGEFFLWISPKTGEAEISIKDPEYGDLVVRELAKVLAPRAVS